MSSSTGYKLELTHKQPSLWDAMQQALMVASCVYMRALMHALCLALLAIACTFSMASPASATCSQGCNNYMRAPDVEWKVPVAYSYSAPVALRGCPERVVLPSSPVPSFDFVVARSFVSDCSVMVGRMV